MAHQSLFIDALQYNNWSEEVFKQINEGGLSAIHVTICYHEDFQEMVQNVIDWNRRFESYSDMIFLGRTADDVRKAQKEGRTAIFFGFQNCSPIEDNIGLVEICHQLGVRFMQLTYNNQSLLATGCYEENDSGITRMGKQVIKEMNRVGLVVDMSHSAERSTLEAIEISERPIVITQPTQPPGIQHLEISLTKSSRHWVTAEVCWDFRHTRTISRTVQTVHSKVFLQ